MKSNQQLADALRSLGLGPLVDSSTIRRMLNIPIRETKSSAQLASISVQENNEKVRQLARDAELTAAAKFPVVSVVMPAYNVEEYIESTINTVLDQTYTRLELIVVNDGSTDGTRKTLERLSGGDPRLRIIHTENEGPGAARNRGIREARGEFLTFVDADDELPPLSLEVRILKLQSSGSDFVIGSFERFDSTRSWKPQWTEIAHGQGQTGIIARDLPSILWDVTLWNKIYRRSSWNRFVGQIPEGVLYEDQQPTAILYVEGARFDVLPDVTYRWHFRDNRSSITQNKASLEDLRERLGAADVVKGILDRGDDSILQDQWYSKFLGEDIHYYAREVPNTDIGFWHVLQAAASRYLAGASEAAMGSISFDRRLQALVLALGTREDFIKVLVYFQENGASWQSIDDGSGRLLAWVPVLDEISLKLDDIQRVVSPSGLMPRVKLVSQHVEQDGGVSFRGFAFVPGAPVDTRRGLSAFLIGMSGTSENVFSSSGEPTGAQIALPVQQVSSFDAFVEASDRHTDRTEAGFDLTLEPSVVSEMVRFMHSGITEWRLRLDFEAWGTTWTDVKYSHTSNGALGYLSHTEVCANGARLQLAFNSDGLHLTIEIPALLLLGYQVTNSGAKLRLGLNPGVDISVANELESKQLKLTLQGVPSFDIGNYLTKLKVGVWECELVFPTLGDAISKNYIQHQLEVSCPSKHRWTIASSSQLARSFSDRPFSVATNKIGNLCLERIAQLGVVDKVWLEDKGRQLVLSGLCKFDPRQIRTTTPTFMLWRTERTLRSTQLEYSEATGEYRVTFSLVEPDADGRETYIPHGDYVFAVLMPTGGRLRATVNPVCSPELLTQLPLEFKEHQTRVILRRKGDNAELFVNVATPFRRDERGPLSQRRLGTILHKSSPPRLQRAVLLESFGGQNVSDSPKALDAWLQEHHPDVKRLWSVQNHTVAVPTGATPVIRFSRAWYEGMATSKYLVNSNNFPAFFRKQQGQTYIQTWHGTPLKKIGNDIPTGHLSASYRLLMQRESERYWDHLIAQTPWAAERLTSAFGFAKEAIADGYPRNDALFGDAAAERRKRVRAYFGLTLGQRVVLYAPTWRDNARNARGQFLQPNYLDTIQLNKRFGRDVIVLMRAHANTAGTPLRASGPNLIDVSKYPDVNDLFLAADVLVTDYSSVMFDFVNTGKPLMFLAPDLEEYRDVTRGFYFDFENSAPGPLLNSTGEIIEGLGSLDGIVGQHRQRYAAFTERFAGLDDAFSTSRVAPRVFAGLNS